MTMPSSNIVVLGLSWACWWYCLLSVVDAFSVGHCTVSHQRGVGVATTTTTTTVGTSPLFSSNADDDNNNNDNNSGGLLSRRQIGEVTVATVGLGTSFWSTRERRPTDYGLYGVLPVGPYKTRQTVFEALVPGQMWTATQKFGILDVQVPQRMTVVKLEGSSGSGGLFLYDPVAATPEVVTWLRDLEKQYGPVKHIVLASVAIEHKVYTSVLAQKFPRAQVWLQPGQYSFPSNLPDSFLGFPASRTFVLPRSPNSSSSTSTSSSSSTSIPKEWKDSGLEYKILGPFISRDGAFGETVFYHRPTKSLLVTDTVVEVTDEVPSIYDLDPKPLLYHARNTVTDVVPDTPEVRKRGWRRVLLFGLYFQPSAIKIKDVNTCVAERRPDINPDFAGIYPFDWVGDDVASFEALKGGLLVAPILQTLILNRNPVEVLDFADAVVRDWPDIQRIVPAHLKNNLRYDARAYRRAFDFLTARGPAPGQPNPLAADLRTLVDANANLLEQGAIAKVPPAVGGKATRQEILARSAYGCRAGLCTEPSPIVLSPSSSE